MSYEKYFSQKFFYMVCRFNDPTVCVNGNVPPLQYNNNSHVHTHVGVEGRSPGVARAATLPRNAYLTSGTHLIAPHNHLDEGTTSFNSPARHHPLSVSYSLSALNRLGVVANTKHQKS